MMTLEEVDVNHTYIKTLLDLASTLRMYFAYTISLFVVEYPARYAIHDVASDNWSLIFHPALRQAISCAF